MRELPILFSTPMVQAILENRKTMTRRMSGLKKVNESPDEWDIIPGQTIGGYLKFVRRLDVGYGFESCKPRYQVGDQLWVKEKYETETDGHVKYYAGNIEVEHNAYYRNLTKWKPSLFMPKVAARLWLEVTGVRCEHLQDISEADAIAEGIEFDSIFESYKCPVCGDKGHSGCDLICDDGFFMQATDAFASLWHKINGFDSWMHDPWVFIYEFKRIEKP